MANGHLDTDDGHVDTDDAGALLADSGHLNSGQFTDVLVHYSLMAVILTAVTSLMIGASLTDCG